MGGCSILCLTVLALLRKLSTIVLIFSLKTCSFSGPNIVEASLIMELRSIDEVRTGVRLDSGLRSYRLDSEDLMETLPGVTARGMTGLSLHILDSNDGTLISATWGNPVKKMELLDSLDTVLFLSVSVVCRVVERSSSVSSRLEKARVLQSCSSCSSSSLRTGDTRSRGWD